MNAYERDFCLKLTKDLKKKHAFKVFIYPVSDDIAPGYSDVIKHPSCLLDVENALKANNIESVEEYKKRINRIWKNCKKYNQGLIQFESLASLGKEIFERKMKKLRKSEAENWNRKVQKCVKKISEVITLMDEEAKKLA
ncbi:Bromodomain containing protein [Trichomonas vaginalis G3]|uniref:Bromodomain containing protein n=1 Tax=Trichomonas vaginalis (strain ATCC PRA-98 / G3) TaxID=412133 RepID=A2E918_TRIV3|nr:acetylation-dependent protein binding [Trichomonas vaginalis G3]EAY10812.1 Bromodomain containing protein [Trichomonas vaginalis G3]KAI5519900.1 acetylation-dependent protein binding [Trichomonas vaginalis G3]|eukprot:XP_001323035.1 Bromodomain containing protein [Trichomonas vaginalis G3]